MTMMMMVGDDDNDDDEDNNNENDNSDESYQNGHKLAIIQDRIFRFLVGEDL